MKSFRKCATILAIGTVSAHAALIQFNGINQSIPDGDSSGLANQQQVSISPGAVVTDVNVRIKFSGEPKGDGFNGDLYVWLSHETGFSVLINRVGRDTGNLFGYGDSGFNVVLDDQASSDIHGYRTTLGGPISPVVGTFQPDAREVDPNDVLSSDPRTAFLSDFHGLDPNGMWTLFVADLEGGGTMRLDGWALDLTFDRNSGAIPDSGSVAGVLIGLLCVRGWLSRRMSA